MSGGKKKVVVWVLAIVIGLPVLFYLFEQFAHFLPASY